MERKEPTQEKIIEAVKKHDGKKFEDEGFMDSHFKSGKPRK